MKNKLLLFGIVAVTAAAVACGEKAAAPVSPSPAVSSETAAAAADGSTLKATAPAPQQPANGSTVTSLTPNLVIANSTLTYLGDVSLVGTLQYRFVVETTGGASVHSVLSAAGGGLTGSRVPANLLQPEVPTGPLASPETASANPCASREAAAAPGSLPRRGRETNPILGWLLLLLGLAGAVWFSHKIATRRTVYGWLGPEEFTLEDNLRTMGPIVLLSLYLAILGLGVIRRWRWAGIPALVLGFVILFVILVALNK